MESSEVPRRRERGGVRGVDDGIDDVEPRKSEVVERALLADVRDQVDERAKNKDLEEVDRRLQGRRREAGDEREEAVDAGCLVERQRQRDQLGAGLQGDETKKGLFCG